MVFVTVVDAWLSTKGESWHESLAVSDTASSHDDAADDDGEYGRSICREMWLYYYIITGSPTHIVGGGQYHFALWRLSSSVTLHCGPAGGFTRAGQAMMSCRLQSNYSSTVTLHGGPVVLRAVRATPC